MEVVRLEKQKKEIIKQLESIDKKSIRAIREGNQELMLQYESEAETLREEYRSL